MKRESSGRRLKASADKDEPGGADEVLKVVRKKVKSKIPQDIKPMLATLVDRPFDSEGWSYEVKWDGFRTLSYLENGKVEIRSRNNKDFNKKFYPIYNALQAWKIDAVFDGEITVLNEKGARILMPYKYGEVRPMVS